MFPSLIVFNISNNLFTGEFSSKVCNFFRKIRVLDLSSIHFSGALEGLETCSTSVQHFHADFNSLSSQLPDSLYMLSSLEQLSLSAKNFSGQLSHKLRKLSNLKTLVLCGNRFSGSFPNVFGNLTQLEQLVAHSNSFSGPLPSTLALCTKLTRQ
ncbi:Phytosulfokine receptor 2 [Forsythia ovata]|uniref:Phytosulfokine receptor 2 n=1 Tax=Forsythia ovata TaxID=205694 RepID=A0ABD1QD66_9LAMI